MKTSIERAIEHNCILGDAFHYAFAREFYENSHNTDGFWNTLRCCIEDLEKAEKEQAQEQALDQAIRDRIASEREAMRAQLLAEIASSPAADDMRVG